MYNLLLVIVGGAFGSAMRYLTGVLALNWFGPDYRWSGTLAVNLIGGLLMGVLWTTLARIGQGGEHWRLLIGVGVLGGFTTFSAFSLDAMTMIEHGDWLPMLGYVLVSVIGAIAALWIGHLLVRAVL